MKDDDDDDDDVRKKKEMDMLRTRTNARRISHSTVASRRLSSMPILTKN